MWQSVCQAQIAKFDIRCWRLVFYFKAMDKIGSKRPQRLFIREWIEHLGLDQKRLAERMDVTEPTVSRLLSGKRKMTLDYLFGFADALNVPVSNLYRDPDMPSREELLSRLSDREFGEVLDFADYLVAKRTGTDG